MVLKVHYYENDLRQIRPTKGELELFDNENPALERFR